MRKAEIEVIRGKMRQSVLVWFFFLFSLFGIAVAVEWLQRGGRMLPIVQNRPLHTGFLLAAVLCFVSMGVFRYFLLKIPIEKPDWGIEILTGRLFLAAVISLGLAAAICLIGLVEFLLLHNPDSFYLFFTLAMVGIILHFPRYPGWKSYLEKMTGAPLPGELSE